MISPFGRVHSKLDRFNPPVGSGLGAAAACGALVRLSIEKPCFNGFLMIIWKQI